MGSNSKELGLAFLILYTFLFYAGTALGELARPMAGELGSTSHGVLISAGLHGVTADAEGAATCPIPWAQIFV